MLYSKKETRTQIIKEDRTSEPGKVVKYLPGPKKKPFDEIPYLENERIVLKKLQQKDAESLYSLAHSEKIYRYLPTFLFEQKYEDIHQVIDLMYKECFEQKESIILGIFLKEPDQEKDSMPFCGLAEMYGFKDSIHKISIGYRLLERYWGKGIATQAAALMADYLYNETDVEIITASTMVENQASANVLRKNGFVLTAAAVGEDWGYPEATITDKWIR